MTGLGARLNRLWRATHTFVGANDRKILADYWKAPLDDANVKPHDLEVECNELRRSLSEIDEGDEKQFSARIQEFAAKNRLAYYAFMYENAVAISQAYPRGHWVMNEAEGFWKILNDARQRATRSKRR